MVRAFLHRLGLIVAVLWVAAILVILAGVAKLGGITPQSLAERYLVPAPLPTPGYLPMSGAVFVHSAKGSCTQLRPKSQLGYLFELDYFDFDFTVCNDLQVEILNAQWTPAGCYLYHVRVPGTRNVKGWIQQDELTPDVNLLPSQCQTGR